MKPLLVALAVIFALLVVSAPRPAEAAPSIVIINTGDDIMYVREVPAKALEAMPDLAGSRVGYHYGRFGVFWLDLWRWSGELVIYKDNTYEAIPPDARELLGGDTVPLAYHLPPGLVALLCGFELFLVARTRRSARVHLALAGGVGAVTAALYVLGLGFSTLLVGGLAIAHVIMALSPPPRRPADFRSEPATTPADQ